MVALRMSKFFTDVMTALRNGIAQYPSARQFAIAMNMNPSTITKWIAKDGQVTRSPNIREIGPIMDTLGVQVLSSGNSGGQNDAQGFIALRNEIYRLEKDNEDLRRKLEIEKEISARLQNILICRINEFSENIEPDDRQNKNCA